ncbi:MAG TPA: hypothetical protein VHS78_09350 [Candidatus Elarobacter sp.]|jgi:hypothetical protein|nr:hypothetical protein [Candidatus Elarobacter sp.]
MTAAGSGVGDGVGVGLGDAVGVAVAPGDGVTPGGGGAAPPPPPPEHAARAEMAIKRKNGRSITSPERKVARCSGEEAFRPHWAEARIPGTDLVANDRSMKVTAFVDVLSHWCLAAQPALDALRATLADDLAVEDERAYRRAGPARS